MNGARNVKFFWPAPMGPGEGSKGQISFNFNYKVNFKDFYSKLCVCSHKWKIQNISDGVFILLPGSSPRGGTLGYLGAKIKFRPAVCPLCYLLLNHWTKFNQIWCVSYSHECGVQRQIFFGPSPWALGRGQKVKYHLISITKSISKIFIPNFVCVLTNERYKTYQTGFLFCPLGRAPSTACSSLPLKSHGLQTWAHKKGADQPSHLHSLISTVVICYLESMRA